VNRRRFLGVGLASAATAGWSGGAWAAEEAESYGLLVDLTRCMGCQACEVSCADVHGLRRPSVKPNGDSAPQSPDAPFSPTTAERLMMIQRLAKDDGGSVWVRKSCTHCLEPACAAACPTGAIERSPAGPVVPVPSRCRGCHRCSVACPLDMPRTVHREEGPRVAFCDLCALRVSRGGLPACAEVCPESAVTFGTRRALIEEARRRMAESPGRYDPHIFGRRELGGMGVLTIAGVPFEALGFPTDLGNEAPVLSAGGDLARALPWLAGAAVLPLLGVDRALGSPPAAEASSGPRPRRRRLGGRRARGLRSVPAVLAVLGAVALATYQLGWGGGAPRGHALPWSAWSSALLAMSAAWAAGCLAVALVSALGGGRGEGLATAAARWGLVGSLLHCLLPLLTPGAPWRTLDAALGLPGGWALGVLGTALLAVVLVREPGTGGVAARRRLLAGAALLAALSPLLHLGGLSRLAVLTTSGMPPLAGGANAVELTLAALVIGLSFPLWHALSGRGSAPSEGWGRAWPLAKASSAALLAMAVLGIRPLFAPGGVGAVASPLGATLLSALVVATLLPAGLLIVGGLRRAVVPMRAAAALALLGAAWRCVQPWLLTGRGEQAAPGFGELVGIVATVVVVAVLAVSAAGWSMGGER
jgi:formate dehydrogenase iron-sulfur subunit